MASHATPWEIDTALAGRIDFVVKTNPWGGGGSEGTPERPSADVGADLLKMLRAHPKARGGAG